MCVTNPGEGTWRSSFAFGLVVTTVIVLALKMLTGLALMPIFLLAAVVFAFAVAFRLRVLRSTAPTRHRSRSVAE